MSGLVTIAGIQMEPKLGKIEANREAMLTRMSQAADQGAKLVVFPECALSGYCFQSREEALPFAETLPGPSVEIIAEACRSLDLVTAFGLLERDGDHLYNACALVGPNGLIGSYRKVHLPFLGVDAFVDPGDRPFAVHEAAGVRVGMHICYDGSFPEAGRTMTLLGAELLILPTNWPMRSECAAEHMVPCRAHENVVYVMAVNRVGVERGFKFIGRSSICDPHGERLAMASPDREEMLIASIDLAVARQKRLVRVPGKHEIDRIRDRRPEFYREIVADNR